MIAEQMNCFLAMIELANVIPFESMAKRLTAAMPGFTFEEEDTGRYEEVPAFVAEKQGMRFVLFGIPEGEVSDAYVLEFACDTEKNHETFKQEAPVFVANFLREDKKINDRGYFDYSEELAQLLRSKGVDCKVLEHD